MTHAEPAPDGSRHVQVRTDVGTWVDAQVDAYRQFAGAWYAFARYSTGSGVSDVVVDWVATRRIRPAAST